MTWLFREWGATNLRNVRKFIARELWMLFLLWTETAKNISFHWNANQSLIESYQCRLSCIFLTGSEFICSVASIVFAADIIGFHHRHIWWLGNCDIDFFVFRHCFGIVCQKFLKFERVTNVAEKFWLLLKRKPEITKLNENFQNCLLLFSISLVLLGTHLFHFQYGWVAWVLNFA